MCKTYSSAIGMPLIYEFHNNDANENYAQVVSAFKFFVEVVVMITPARIAILVVMGLICARVHFESSHPSLNEDNNSRVGNCLRDLNKIIERELASLAGGFCCHHLF